jgi:hypothetical protein
MSKKQTGKSTRLYNLRKDDVFYFPENKSINYIVTSTKGPNGERQFYIKPLGHDGLSFWQLNVEVIFVSAFKDYGKQE